MTPSVTAIAHAAMGMSLTSLSPTQAYDKLYTLFPAANAADIAEAYGIVSKAQARAEIANRGELRFFNEIEELHGFTGLLRVRVLVSQPCQEGTRTGSIDVIVGGNEAIGSVLQYGEQYAEEVLLKGLSDRAEGGEGPCTGRPDMDIILIQDATDPFSETNRPPYGGR